MELIPRHIVTTSCKTTKQGGQATFQKRIQINDSVSYWSDQEKNGGKIREDKN